MILNIWKNIIRKMGLIISSFLFMVGTLWLSTASNAETFTSHGLDLTQVHLVVEGPHEYYERFFERVQGHLTQASLSTTSKRTYSPMEPILRFTLDVQPLDKTLPKHFLYTQKLEVVESVFTERTPKVRAFAVTWYFGSMPEVRNSRITVEELEKDLDRLIEVFILEYQYANQ